MQHRESAEPATRLSVRAVATALLLALIPLAACVVAMVIGFRRRDGEFMPVKVFIDGLPFLLAAVALPSAFPIWVATGRRTTIGVVVAMTALAVIAGAINAAADDSQAGLPLVWVVTLGIPLAGVVACAQVLQSVIKKDPFEWQLRRRARRESQ